MGQDLAISLVRDVSQDAHRRHEEEPCENDMEVVKHAIILES